MLPYGRPLSVIERRCLLFLPVIFLLALRVILPPRPCLADVIGALKAEPPTPAGTAFNDGAKALSTGDVATAEADFKKSLRLDPKEAGAYLGLAKLALRKGDRRTAGVFLQKAATVAPQDANVQTTWGHYLFWQKRLPEAEAALKKAIQLDPLSARPQTELADLYLVGMRRPKAAVDHYRAALGADPNDAGLHFMLGQALAGAGELDQAERELQESARLEPKNPAFWRAPGDFRARRQQFKAALDAYAKALDAQSNFAYAHLARGDVFARMGEPDKALAEYQGGLEDRQIVTRPPQNWPC